MSNYIDREKSYPNIPVLDPDRVRLLVVDSFCGAGGYTEGVEQAVDSQGYRTSVVIVGINHDKDAIASHAANHPETVHFVEDVRDETLPRQILAVVERGRKLYPNARLLFHASLECVNFSNAKGGKSRDADSRSLADFMPLYLRVLQPDIFTVENVREFMAWGPLIAKPNMKHTFEGFPAPVCEMVFDKKKQQWHYHWVPESRTKGKDYVRWYQNIEAMGYRYDYRLHNTADFGANTSRTRYFAQFVREKMPLAWPKQTHAKVAVNGNLFTPSLARWKPIRDCLDLLDKGKSIFRNPPLSEKTYERIYEGLVRHVGNGDRSFISKYFTGEGMHLGLDQPAATIKTIDGQALVTAEPFMARLFATASNNHGTYPTDQPATTITTADGHAVISAEPFVANYHSGSAANRVKGMDDPAQTLTTENRLALISSEPFVVQSNGGPATAKSYPADQPARVVTTSDNQAAIFCMKYHTQGGHNTFPADEPCSTLPTKDSVGVVATEQFISHYYSNGKQDDSVEAPAASLTTIPKHRLVSADVFVDQQYGNSQPACIDQPANTLANNPKLALVKAFIVDPQWGGHSHSIEQPGHTIIARQDKAPSSVVSTQFITQRNGPEPQGRSSAVVAPAKTLTATGGNLELVSSTWLLTNQHHNAGTSLNDPCPTLLTGNHHYVMSTNFSNIGIDTESAAPTITADRHWCYLITTESNAYVPAIIMHPNDGFWVRRIKAFMAYYGIVDVLMRMLKVNELKLIQGFPVNYVLNGSQTLQKKFIGNSVPPPYVKAWIEAISAELVQQHLNKDNTRVDK